MSGRSAGQDTTEKKLQENGSVRAENVTATEAAANEAAAVAGEKGTAEEADHKVPFSYWTLFKSTFIISAFTVGGGFVIIPLLKSKYVDEYGWLKEKESLDLVAIAQSAPGVVAANASIIMGYRMGGILGTLTALLATVLPPLITLTAISYCYAAFSTNPYVKMVLKGMQCGVAALILNVVLDLALKQAKKKLVLPMLIMAGSFIGSYFFHVNIMYIILVDALVGLLLMRDAKYN